MSIPNARFKLTHYLIGGDESAFKQLQTDTLAFAKELGLATDKPVPGATAASI